MSSVLNDTRLNCDCIGGPEDAFLEAKNEYNVGYEHSSNVLSALFNWRSKDYTSEKR